MFFSELNCHISISFIFYVLNAFLLQKNQKLIIQFVIQ